MVATRNVALTELPIRGISINADAAGQTVNVVASDSGVIFINKEDAGQVTYNLPAVADAAGKMFWFFDAQLLQSMLINAPADTLFCGNNLAADNIYSTAQCGCCGFVICDGTSYYFFEIYGTWTAAG